MVKVLRVAGRGVLVLILIWAVTLPLIIGLADSSVSRPSGRPADVSARSADPGSTGPGPSQSIQPVPSPADVSARSADPRSTRPDRSLSIQPVASPPDDERILFGFGGENCALALIGRIFSASDRVRFVTRVAPGAGDATVALRPSGRPDDVDGYPHIQSMTADAHCVSGDLAPLPVGSYRVSVQAAESQSSGTFTVAP